MKITNKVMQPSDASQRISHVVVASELGHTVTVDVTIYLE